MTREYHLSRGSTPLEGTQSNGHREASASRGNKPLEGVYHVIIYCLRASDNSECVRGYDYNSAERSTSYSPDRKYSASVAPASSVKKTRSTLLLKREDERPRGGTP